MWSVVDDALREEAPGVLRLQTPARFWRLRALTLGVLVPALLGVLIGLFALLDVLDSGEPGGLTLAAVAGCALLLVPCLGVALAHLALASRRSARTRVTLDLGGRDPGEATLTTAQGVWPLAAVSSLELVKPTPLLKWLAIEAVIAEPRAETGNPFQAPRDGRVRLLGHINELETGKARVLMADLGARLGVETTDRTSVLLGGGGASGAGDGRLAHALAYLPIQGIFLLVSLFLLVARKDDPRAQLHARQSLALLLVEIPLVLLAVGVCVVALGLSPLLAGGEPFSAEPHPAGIAVAVLALTGVLLVRVVGRFYASWQAWKGRLWLIPGLSLWSRRWLPSDEAGAEGP